MSAVQRLQQWLNSDRPASRRQAAWGRAYQGWRAFAGNRLALVGLALVLLLVGGGGAGSADRPLRPHGGRIGPAPAATLGHPLAGHRRPGPRHPLAPDARCTHHAVRGGAGGGAGRAHRPAGGHGVGLRGRLGGCRADAGDRHLPGLSAPGAGPGLCGSAGPGDRERGDCHRHHLLAPLCPHRTGRNPEPAPGRLHQRRAAAGRQPVAHRVAPHHADVPGQRGGAGDAGHGGHHPHRRRPGLPGPGSPAAHARMGRDDRQRPAVCARPVVGGRGPGRGHLRGEPGLQPAGRWCSGRPRPQAQCLNAGPQPTATAGGSAAEGAAAP